MKTHSNRFLIGAVIVLALGWPFIFVSAATSSATLSNKWKLTSTANGPSTSDICRFLGVDSATYDLQLPHSGTLQIRVEVWKNAKSVNTGSLVQLGVDNKNSLSILYKLENDNLSVMVATPPASGSINVPMPTDFGQLLAKSKWSASQLKLQEKEIPVHAVFYNKNSIISPQIDEKRPESVLDAVRDFEGAVVFFIKVSKAKED